MIASASADQAPTWGSGRVGARGYTDPSPEEAPPTDVARSIASLPLRSPSPSPARVASLVGAVVRSLPAGGVLLREGGPRETLAVVERGCLALRVTGPTGRTGIVRVVGPGGIIAADGLTEARAMVPSRVLVAPLDRARRLAEVSPEAGAWLAARLTDAVQDLSAGLSRALTLSVPERLLATLQDLAARHGRPVPGGVRIVVPLTQDTLAELVGATRESVNRALGRLGGRGAIRRDGRTYVLVAAPPPAPGPPGGTE